MPERDEIERENSWLSCGYLGGGRGKNNPPKDMLTAGRERERQRMAKNGKRMAEAHAEKFLHPILYRIHITEVVGWHIVSTPGTSEALGLTVPVNWKHTSTSTCGCDLPPGFWADPTGDRTRSSNLGTCPFQLSNFLIGRKIDWVFMAKKLLLVRAWLQNRKILLVRSISLLKNFLLL